MRLAQVALPLVLIFCGWQQPVPTNSIHITGESGASVQISISDELPDGTVTQAEWRARVPARLFVNADHHLRLKVESETPIEAQRFYEDAVGKEWLGTVQGDKDVPITFDIPAR